MEKVSLGWVLFVSLFLSITPPLLVRLNFFSPVFFYQGTITDALDGFPVDLVEVSASGKKTYTDKDGKFTLKTNSKAASVSARPMSDFEMPPVSMACDLKTGNLLSHYFGCQQNLYPQPYSVAMRVLATLHPSGSPTAEVSRALKEKLWNYLSSPSRQVWQSADFLADLLVPFEETNRRLKNLAVSYAVERNYQKVGPFRYLGQEIKGEVVKVSAKLSLVSGRTETRDLYFVKEAGLWKYLFEETPRRVTEFNQRNIWVFNKKPGE